MKKLLTLITLIIVSTLVFSQEQLPKTSIVKNSTYKNGNKQKGFELIGVSARFGTKMENQVKVEESIILREFIYDTLIVEVVTPANCCASFECELQVKENNTLNLKFTKEDQDCFCLRGIYLSYKIAVKSRTDNSIELNGKPLEYRKHDPNESRDVTEYYDNGQLKSVKMYLGDELKRVSYFDETGKRTKMIMYNNGQVIEKNY